MQLNLQILLATNEVFKRLNNLRRWTSFVTEDKYNELSKQSLNCIVAYMLAAYSEEEGINIKWENFPKIALYRAFQKVYVYFDTPEHIIKEICKLENINKDCFNAVTNQIIAELAGEDFSEYFQDILGSYELRIYRAASKIATYIEFVENSNKMSAHDHFVQDKKLLDLLKEFQDLPGISDISNIEGNIFKVLQTISTLRNKNRWAAQSYSVECSVLGHLFDTAVFAYFMSIEEYPEDEKMASKMFFMGIFHDVAETWTTDIPSPIKDRIPNFRKATEKYELIMIEKELYSKVPPFLADKLKEVMFESDENKSFKKLLKGADYLSADSECWRQYIAGSRDAYFLGAILRRIPKIKSGEVMLTPVCDELFNVFLKYAKKVNL